MIAPLRKLFRQRRSPRPAAAVPEGERHYAIGDVHGRADLLRPLIAAIEEEEQRASPARTRITLLGDLVDRGPDSAAVIQLARQWQAERDVRILMGNHEEMFLQSFEDIEVLRHFLRHGGRETLLSFGMDRETFTRLTLEELFALMGQVVPRKVREWIAGFELMIEAGDYLFVHAGIDPARPIEEQQRSDLLWIRERFLRHEGALPRVVVHGHTIFDEVSWTDHRIGIDTGAFASGVLTALVLEGTGRSLIQAVQQDGAIAIRKQELE